ncbi:cystin-1 isoform X2 [Phaenicophaeus curvirostris]|uniref:cystin-1 isoform X2 n=1 Tax=Phaenicophaeus curvirostris TaxID=33595 RepID=UPI0037F0B626
MGSGSSRRRGPAGRGTGHRDPRGTAPARGEEEAVPPPGPGGSSPARDTGGGSRPQPAVLSPRSPPGPEDDTVDHQCPQRNSKSTGKSTISYDYSEEELMASIEREYCR